MSSKQDPRIAELEKMLSDMAVIVDDLYSELQDQAPPAYLRKPDSKIRDLRQHIRKFEEMKHDKYFMSPTEIHDQETFINTVSLKKVQKIVKTIKWIRAENRDKSKSSRYYPALRIKVLGIQNSIIHNWNIHTIVDSHRIHAHIKEVFGYLHRNQRVDETVCITLHYRGKFNKEFLLWKNPDEKVITMYNFYTKL